MNKKEEKINSLQEQFNKIQEDNSDLDVGKYLAKTSEHLPDLGEIQIYDYDTDIEKAKKQGDDILESMVDLYLGDNPNVANHRYIRTKMKEDAKIYADTIFLQEMTRKNLLTQLRQVDNGDNSARMHEVVNQSFSQIRDNVKFAISVKTDLEKFYKEIRKDMGLNEISETMEQKHIDQQIEEGSQKEEGKIVDSRSLNDMIDKYIKNKD
jgi:hypothetical protein